MRGTLALMVSLLLILLPCGATAQTSPPAPQVAFPHGLLEGTQESGITSFRGIEYARAQRWQLPEAAPAWIGTKSAKALGPACPQSGQTVMVENCLFLNVHTPSTRPLRGKLPVVVWIHGGGFRAGAGGEGPRSWVRDGIVVVTFNYRLGVLGFQDWAGWRESDPRNFGQADMVAALRWVRAHIARFGGDPAQVTIYGHSAGGMGVQLMMTDPRARGLFARAIADAGYADWPFPKAMNPSDEMRTRMRYAPLDMAATPQELVAQTPFFRLPFVGGSDLPAQPSALFERGRVARVPYIAGFNSYDGGSTLLGAGFNAESFGALYAEPAALRALYASDYAASADQGARRAFGDRRYGVSAVKSVRAMARYGGRAQLFFVDDYGANEVGAGHGSHVRPMFVDGQGPLKAYFVNFIKTGSTTGGSLPHWPLWRGQQGHWLVIKGQPSIARDPLRGRLEALDRLPFAPDAALGVPSR
jgi:para-nitrobenzyl esterase